VSGVKDETRKRYSRLYVTKRCDRPGTNRVYWLCKCDCGNFKQVLGDHLRSGATVSCGCVGQKKKEQKQPSPRTIRWRKQRDREAKISTAATINRENYLSDRAFVRPHVYRTPRKLDMGTIVAAARAALAERRAA